MSFDFLGRLADERFLYRPSGACAGPWVESDREAFCVSGYWEGNEDEMEEQDVRPPREEELTEG